MPTWGEILTEVQGAAQQLHAQGVTSVNPFDLVRRKYLGAVAAHTKRSTILYTTAWLSNPVAPVPLVSLTDDDMLGFMEAVQGLDGPNLDLIVHSPGGAVSAAEQVVEYLRTKFEHIRVVVPHMAMSAATMIACAADQIVMGRHSFLGPIDPQLILQTALGNRAVPAQNILEQFERALREGADAAKLRVWAPMLTQYGPDLLVTCQNLVNLSEELVSQWLKSYMFKGQADAEAKGKAIARWLAGHSTFKTHARPLSRDELIANGLTGICALEQEQTEQDLFLSVHHATAHTFTSTAAVKIIENNLGKAYMRMLNVVQPIQMMQTPVQPSPPAPVPPPGPPQQQSQIHQGLALSPSGSI